MDDKVIVLDIAWPTVKSTSQVALAEYILKLTRGTRETKH
ncbi:hypothetical protein ABIF63_004833 [Bradyrhizobium japonicum]|uniref:Uncharacterized protein n=1 Tax=Bradyrhizobium japonicum TaxID=375 RepID=A0ABV2RV10_BRAJP